VASATARVKRRRRGGRSSDEWRRIERRIEGEEPIKEYLLLEAAAVGRRTWESG
jgi:hypothetical protein